jgi:hypothetical protein
MGILHLAADTPVLIRALAGAALVTHIGGASLGIVSGFTALIARKGGRLHRAAGNVFFVSMLAMSGVAAVVAPMLPDRFSALTGLLVFYLTATAWLVVKRPAGTVGRLETFAVLIPLAVAVGDVWLAQLGSHMPDRLIDGEPSQLGYAGAMVATIAAALDLHMIRRGGLSGPLRTARHLWRMCVALFAATGSAVGQPKVVALLPKIISHSALLLFTPALLVLALMVFWLIQVRVPRRRRAPSNLLAAT